MPKNIRCTAEHIMCFAKSLKQIVRKNTVGPSIDKAAAKAGYSYPTGCKENRSAVVLSVAQALPSAEIVREEQKMSLSRAYSQKEHCLYLFATAAKALETAQPSICMTFETVDKSVIEMVERTIIVMSENCNVDQNKELVCRTFWNALRDLSGFMLRNDMRFFNAF